MKGFIACSLALLGNLKQRRLRRPLHFAFSYDEEVGCFGAHALVNRIVADIPKPAFVIVGEPTDMRIGVAHNGVIGSDTTFPGCRRPCERPLSGSQCHRRRGCFSYDSSARSRDCRKSPVKAAP